MKLVNEKEFNELIKEGVTFVDFFANWCGPCRMMGPIVEELAKEFEGKVNVVKVDVDEEEDLSRKYGILSIPTLAIFKNGEYMEKHVGFWPKESCAQTLKKYL